MRGQAPTVSDYFVPPSGFPRIRLGSPLMCLDPYGNEAFVDGSVWCCGRWFVQKLLNA